MHVLVRYEVEEFDRWKAAFEERAPIRREHGCEEVTVFTRHGSDDRVVVLASWNDAENARSYFESTAFRRAMQDAGVGSKPDVTFLERVDDIELAVGEASDSALESGDDPEAPSPDSGSE